MTTHKKKTLKYALAAVFICLCVFTLFLVLLFFGGEDDTYVVFESVAPTGSGKAFFLQESSMLDRTTDLFVSDQSRQAGRPIWAGTIDNSDRGILMEEAKWSKDGSLIYSKLQVLRQGKGKTEYVGYDFRSHRLIKNGHFSRLIEDRGGKGNDCLQVGTWRSLRKGEIQLLQRK